MQAFAVPVLLAVASILAACGAEPSQPPARPSSAATNRGEGEACGAYPAPVRS
jgi:hypothetical protein